MEIVSTENLPSTTNAWGFGGARDKVRYTMENGDVWVSGTACFRHAPSQRYVQLMKADNPNYSADWIGGWANADKDVDLRGSAKTYIKRYYTRKS
jgi:hypothetical protein